MKKLVVSSAVLLACSAFAAAPSLTGEWSVHASVAGNESDRQCKFVVTDNKLTGSCKLPEGKERPLTGSVDGKKVTWKYDSEYGGGPITLTYTATLTDDSDKITGSVEVEPYGVTGDFTATPVKDAAK